jgi:hypothetical protein
MHWPLVHQWFEEHSDIGHGSFMQELEVSNYSLEMNDKSEHPCEEHCSLHTTTTTKALLPLLTPDQCAASTTLTMVMLSRRVPSQVEDVDPSRGLSARLAHLGILRFGIVIVIRPGTPHAICN